MRPRPRFLRYGLLAFIDLLGFSAKVQSIESDEDLLNLRKEVEGVQILFEHKPTDDLIKETHRITNKKVTAFSDCLVVSVFSESDIAEIQGTFDVFMGEVNNFALAQGQCVVNKIFIRGGADYGIWYKRKDTLISPALVNAHDLEKSACVPMIAISDKLYGTLANHPHRKYYSSDIDPIRHSFRRFENLPNGESHWFIDYLPACIEVLEGPIVGSERIAYRAASPAEKERMRAVARNKALDEWIGSHRDAIIQAGREAANDAIRAKYVWLAEYHNDSISRCFRRPSSDWFISNERF